MMRWRDAEREHVAPAAPAAALLRKALAAHPERADLHLKLALLAVDRFDFRAARAGFEDVVRLAPDMPYVRSQLASCCNLLKDHEGALEVLAPVPEAQQERGIAFLALGRLGEAEAEFRAVLAADPSNRQACRRLCRILRESGRWKALLETCETLAERGACHTQLLYDRGIALALNGETAKARAILFDRRRVSVSTLALADPGEDPDEFNASLAEEISSIPDRVSEFVIEEAANRGSSRVHSLFAGRNPDLVRRLLRAIEGAVEAYPLPAGEAFDSWAAARPHCARLNAWGLIQRCGDYEAWHMHRDGWLSGVYYVRVPRTVSAEGEGRGCIEFGPPGALEALIPGMVPYWRCAPREGLLLLAPSHYPHRTIPTGSDDLRISFAFDVVPEPAAK